MKKHRSTLFGIALLITIILTLLIIDRTTASTSTCNRPADPSVSGIKRGVVANILEYDNVEDNDDYDEVSSPKVVIEGDDDDNSTLPLVMDTPGSSIDTMGVLREIPSYVQEIIDKQPEIFNNVTGATNKNLKHRKEFIGKKRTHCVACRLNCMNLGVFAACERKYHFYGCKFVSPCITEATATKETIKAAVGICIDRNGCILKKLKNIFEYKLIKNQDGQVIKHRVKIVPRLPRVYKKVKRLAHNISDE